MEGYSVTEAASILGVPTERVWELLARGVLSGAADGETGMRVYLQPRPSPAPPVAEPGRPNGDATREPERELSPFRELLTEFRNLTERYGQALLALGEARGEVAALRSRVDLLEARMDLRLPMSAPTPWPAPTSRPAERDATTAEESDASPDVEADVVHESGEDRQPRRRRHRRATENFAEALARAEDPTRPELPGAAETAAALAALRADGAADARGTDSSLPRELPAADAIPMADEADRPVAGVDAPDDPPLTETETSGAPSTAVNDEPAVEPPPSVGGETDAPASAAAAPEPSPLAVVAEAEAAEGVEDDLPVAPDAEPEVEEAITEPEPEPVSEPASEPIGEGEPEPEPAPEPVAAADPEPAAAVPDEAPAPDDPGPITWDPERYSVDIGEPDWFVEEEPARAAVSEEPGPSVEQAPPPSQAEDAFPATPADLPAEPMAAEAASGTEETMLWFGTDPSADPAATAATIDTDTGADEMEVVGSQPPPTPRALPGSTELDEALAALDALAGRTSTAEPAQSAGPAEGAGAARAWPEADRPATAPLPARPEPFTSRGSAEPPRLATTPASRAYRRLRRIFPG